MAAGRIMRKPKPAVAAASLMLIRDGADGLETLMVSRHAKAAFAPGALVFTGGKVDRGDFAPDLANRCDGAADLDPSALAPRIAAIREAFEEGGVFLARESTAREFIDGRRAAALQRHRGPLARGDIAFDRLLAEEDLILGADRLEVFAHGITPEFRPLRFDTRFYLAAAPKGQDPTHDGVETMASFWTTPDDALAGGRSGRWDLMMPTRLNLELLSRSARVAEALAAARGSKVVTVTPWIERRADGAVLRIPDHAGYGDVAEPVGRPH